MANQFNKMALQLFVDPNEGARAYARGIEKAFDSIGDAAGNILQSYNDARVKKQQLLGTLVAYDDQLDNFKQSKEYLVQQNDKDKQSTLLGHYERKYETLASMEGALQGVAVAKEREKELREKKRFELEERRAKSDLKTARQVRREKNLLIEQREQVGKRMTNMVGNADNLFTFTGNYVRDEEGVVKNIAEARSLLAVAGNSPESAPLRSIVSNLEKSLEYQTHFGNQEIKRAGIEDARGYISKYTKYFGPEVMNGLTSPIDSEKLVEEIKNGNTDGAEQWKVRSAKFVEKQAEYLSKSPAPGYILDAMGVPDSVEIARQNRLPTKAEIRAFEQFDKRYQSGDLSLFQDVTDTRTAIQLSAMNKTPLERADRESLDALTNATRGIGDILSMLEGGPESGQPLEWGGKTISEANTGIIWNTWSEIKKKIDGTGDLPLEVFKSKVKGLVSVLARSVFGETGVLTDQDVDRYSSLLADANSSTELNVVLSDMLLEQVRHQGDTLYKSLAKSGKNVSGYLSTYAQMQPKLNMAPMEVMDLATQGKLVPGRKVGIVDPVSKEVHTYDITRPEEFGSYMQEVVSSLSKAPEDPEGVYVYKGGAMDEQSAIRAQDYETNPQPDQILESPPGETLPSEGGQGFFSQPQIRSNAPDLLNAPGTLFRSMVGKRYFNNPGAINLGSTYKFPSDPATQDELELFFNAEGGSSREFKKLLADAKAGDKKADAIFRDISFRNQRMQARDAIRRNTPLNLFFQ